MSKSTFSVEAHLVGRGVVELTPVGQWVGDSQDRHTIHRLGSLRIMEEVKIIVVKNGENYPKLLSFLREISNEEFRSAQVVLESKNFKIGHEPVPVKFIDAQFVDMEVA
jgi:hypothetical protein